MSRHTHTSKSDAIVGKIKTVAKRGYATKGEAISIMASCIEDKDAAGIWSEIWGKTLESLAIGGTYADGLFTWEKKVGNVFELRAVSGIDAKRIIK